MSNAKVSGPDDIVFPIGTWIGIRDKNGRKICVGDKILISVKGEPKVKPSEHVVGYRTTECFFYAGPYHLGNGSLFENIEYEVA